MKRSHGFPQGPIWDRPAKRTAIYTMHVHVTVDDSTDIVPVVADPWTKISAIIADVSTQVGIPDRLCTTLYIRGVECQPRHQLSRYTNTVVTPAKLVTMDPTVDIFGVFGKSSSAGAASSGAAAPSSQQEPPAGAEAPASTPPPGEERNDTGEELNDASEELNDTGEELYPDLE